MIVALLQKMSYIVLSVKVRLVSYLRKSSWKEAAANLQAIKFINFIGNIMMPLLCSIVGLFLAPFFFGYRIFI